MKKHLIKAFLLLGLSFLPYLLNAQNQLIEKPHYLLGIDVIGYQISVPFSKAEAEEAWKEYGKAFGRSEETQGHKAYEAVFQEDIYSEKVLLFVEISGSDKESVLWVGIDPQGVPKDIYSQLKNKLGAFVYDFSVKMRKDAAQEKIDESERAASFLSKSFEELKREERKNLRNEEKNNQKIIQYEQELKTMRSDSIQYKVNIEQLNIKLDSIYLEIEKIRKLNEFYKKNLEEIK